MLERLGKYEILETIAAGGQGTVYRARDSGSGDVVALSLEANLASRLDHPNIVKVFDVQVEEDDHIANTLLRDLLHHLAVFIAVIFPTGGNIGEGRHRVKPMGTAVILEGVGRRLQGYMALPGLSRGAYSEVAYSGGGTYSGGHGSLDETGCHDSSKYAVLYQCICPDHHPLGGQSGTVGGHRQSEVTYLGNPVRGEPHVAGFQVPVDYIP